MRQVRYFDFHKDLMELHKQERNLRSFLALSRTELDEGELLLTLWEVRGEIARMESLLHARSKLQRQAHDSRSSR
jgi:hypothetical protein